MATDFVVEITFDLPAREWCVCYKIPKKTPVSEPSFY